jgi:hypothetical protein
MFIDILISGSLYRFISLVFDSPYHLLPSLTLHCLIIPYLNVYSTFISYRCISQLTLNLSEFFI